MNAITALILFAHGSRAPQTLEEMGILSAKLQQSRTGFLVIPAFLELTTPNLTQALGQVADQGIPVAHILPLFLFTGKHILEDIPALIKANQAIYPQVRLILHEPIGHHAAFPDFLMTACGLT